MATRVCPECGSQYVASVRRCIDCDVVLVDEQGPDGGSTSSTVATSSGDQVAYELEGWGAQLCQTLAGMLDLAGVPFVWEAGTLVVPAPFEAEVDRCIAAVEGDDAEVLDEEAELAAFEIEGVSLEELEDLDGLLIAKGIAHAWSDQGELLVAVENEDAVAALIDGLLAADGEDADDDGLALHEALDALFVATDKLVKDPLEAKLGRRFSDAADRLDAMGLPYGMAPAEWASLLALVADVRTAISGDELPAADDADADEVDDAAVEAEADVEAEAEVRSDEDGDREGDEVDEGEAPPSPAERARGLVAELRDRLRSLV